MDVEQLQKDYFNQFGKHTSNLLELYSFYQMNQLQMTNILAAQQKTSTSFNMNVTAPLNANNTSAFSTNLKSMDVSPSRSFQAAGSKKHPCKRSHFVAGSSKQSQTASANNNSLGQIGSKKPAAPTQHHASSQNISTSLLRQAPKPVQEKPAGSKGSVAPKNLQEGCQIPKRSKLDMKTAKALYNSPSQIKSKSVQSSVPPDRGPQQQAPVQEQAPLQQPDPEEPVLSALQETAPGLKKSSICQNLNEQILQQLSSSKKANQSGGNSSNSKK